MFNTDARKRTIHVTLGAALFLIATPVISLMAQGVDRKSAIDTIVGSDIIVGEEKSGLNEQRIIAAIENSSANAADVRRKYSLDKVEIILLTDIGDETTPIGAKLTEYKPQVTELQESIQGSAMFYHAVDSHSIMLNRIVALEFDDQNGVTIFVSSELLHL